MGKLSLYRVSSDYGEYLLNFDKKVPYISDEKSNRPFVGIVLKVNGFDYFAPFTSPKSKHCNVSNKKLDFLKIDGGKLGGINFNNMLPVPEMCLEKINFRNEDVKYQNLLINQLSWCNSNSDKIIKRAERLYKIVQTSEVNPSLLNRCCDFKLLEKKCREYIQNLDRGYERPQKESFVSSPLPSKQEAAQSDAETFKKMKSHFCDAMNINEASLSAAEFSDRINKIVDVIATMENEEEKNCDFENEQ